MRIYDGDTVAPTVRLTIDAVESFDAPETFRPRCPQQLALGQRATRQLREIIDRAERVVIIPILDDDGSIAVTRGSRPRLLMRMEADGENVGAMLAREGLAMQYRWETERVDWCATPPVRLPR